MYSQKFPTTGQEGGPRKSSMVFGLAVVVGAGAVAGADAVVAADADSAAVVSCSASAIRRTR